jgi:hypothetical protein
VNVEQKERENEAMNATNRLDEIAKRNIVLHRKDIAFAAMVAALLVYCLASLRIASAQPLHVDTMTDASAHTAVAHADRGVCTPDSIDC